jgi:hypothetical protein
MTERITEQGRALTKENPPLPVHDAWPKGIDYGSAC